MDIRDIKAYQKKISIIGKIVEKTDLRTVVSRLDNVEHKVCEALVGDETGTVYLTLWDKSIDDLQDGKIYSFENLYSSEFKKSLRLNLGRFGEFKELDKDIKVNTDNKISIDV